MPTQAAKELHHYFMVLSRYINQISCPYCNKYLLPRYFETHVFRNHGINGKYNCVWCHKVSWLRGTKYKHKNHLITCFREFVKANRIHESNDASSTSRPQSNNNSSPSASNSKTNNDFYLLDMTHEFPEKDFFGHQLAYPEDIDETIWPLENLPPLPISFADENLNLAAAYVLLYLTETYDFFHVMIKCQAMKSFLQAMNEDEGRSRTLSFSCWCDGGEYEEAKYRQHRHFIIVAPKNHFEQNVWRKIKLSNEDRPINTRNYQCKRLTLIESPLHLVNTIGYLSQRESQCELSFSGNESVNTRDNHFYLYKTLPKRFKLCLVLLWKDGLIKYLKCIKFQNVSIPRLAESVLTHDGRRWTQKIKDFYGHERGIVIPVDREYIPTDRVTPHFLHLMNDKVLYFDKSPENRDLDRDTWLRKQIEGGNCFYDAVEENFWVPRPRDQAVLNFYKPVIDKNRELESKVKELEVKVTELEDKNRELESKKALYIY